jgi:hypothetical protein
MLMLINAVQAANGTCLDWGLNAWGGSNETAFRSCAYLPVTLACSSGPGVTCPDDSSIIPPTPRKANVPQDLNMGDLNKQVVPVATCPPPPPPPNTCIQLDPGGSASGDLVKMLTEDEDVGDVQLRIVDESHLAADITLGDGYFFGYKSRNSTAVNIMAAIVADRPTECPLLDGFAQASASCWGASGSVTFPIPPELLSCPADKNEEVTAYVWVYVKVSTEQCTCSSCAKPAWGTTNASTATEPYDPCNPNYPRCIFIEIKLRCPDCSPPSPPSPRPPSGHRSLISMKMQRG